MVASVRAFQPVPSAQPVQVRTPTPHTSPGAPGISQVPDIFVSGEIDAAKLPGTIDYEKLVKDILQPHGYGPAALAAAAPELRRYGIYVQQASDGGYRGRIVLPDGHKFDICDPNESMHWWTDLRGSAWGWKDQGFDRAAYGGTGETAISFSVTDATTANLLEMLQLHTQSLRRQANLTRAA